MKMNGFIIRLIQKQVTVYGIKCQTLTQNGWVFSNWLKVNAIIIEETQIYVSWPEYLFNIQNGESDENIRENRLS